MIKFDKKHAVLENVEKSYTLSAKGIALALILSAFCSVVQYFSADEMGGC